MGIAITERRVSLLGSQINPLTLDETVACVERMITSREPHIHACINAAKIVSIRENPALAEAVEAADLVSADGQSIVWAARILKTHIPERVAGIDLMWRLLRLADSRKYRVFFLGSTTRVLADLCERVATQFPGAIVAGTQDGYFTAAGESVVLTTIRQAEPDILFVGMSSPKKEMWLARHRGALGVPFAMGVGGSFEVLAGHRKRAPRVLQRMGLEWSFRLTQEPARMWRRYLVGNIRFLWLLAATIAGRVDSDQR